MKSISPTDGQVFASFEPLEPEETLERLARTHRAQADWRRSSFSERAHALLRWAELFEERAQELAEGIAREMGKPLREGVGEARKCALACRYYAEHGEAHLTAEAIETEARASYVAYRPLGVVLAIMPWNFPLWQVVRFGAPALMAGNGFLLKHAPNVTGTSLALERMATEAGFPQDLVQSLVVDVDQVPALIADPRVAGVTLTGSTRAGRIVAELAGRALKPTVLELGGSDPYLILEDADLDLALEACATSRLLNAGQSCIAAKRFLVVDAVRAEFTERLVERFRASRTGDPLDEATDLGPLARLDLRDALARQVDESVAKGAVLACGGVVPAGPGAFYPPTVLTNVSPGAPAWSEELFGPVASVIAVADEVEAVRVANGTSFGLGAAVFTRDVERGRRIAEVELEAGSCFVNDFVKSDPRLPFGGIRDSGYGRESSRLGLHEFVNAKTVVVA